MTGPGIRHILGVGDGTEVTQPPNERKDWKYVFVQSRGEDRDLHQGTKYLFCKKQIKFCIGIILI